jgi:hypothetical protein
MSGPYGPKDTPGPGEGHSDPAQQWSGQSASGAEPTQQWAGQQPWAPQQWGQPGRQQPWAPQATGNAEPTQQWTGQQPQWGQQSSPSWPQQPAQTSPWDSTQQQWGSQPQPQWGQSGQWGQQPAAPGQPEPALQIGKKKRSHRGLVFGGIGALVVVVVVVVLALVFMSSNKLDNGAVQQGVQKVLKDSYGIDDVQDVNCPSGEKVKVGNSFDCSMKVGGESKKVTIKITKSDGTYEVGRPN